MKRVMVYSHDTFGMGNISRMLSISKQLIKSIPDLSILLITGSPVMHGLRLPSNMDYIKLPCLTRTDVEDYSAKWLGTEIAETIKLRSDLIKSAVVNYRPDVALIDKKPTGVKHELLPALEYMKAASPSARLALVLRDILDSPSRTIRSWRKHGDYDSIRSFYDLVLVLGSAEVFDPRTEYCFPASVSEKTRFCGYIQRDRGSRNCFEVRQELGIEPEEKLILVTPGGGEDGFKIIAAYVAAQERLQARYRIQSLVLCGPEMPEVHRETLRRRIGGNSRIRFSDFTNNLMEYMNAADVVVSMGGYNTVCELLSLNKRAIVVPRVQPVQEQLIRVQRMGRLGLFKTIHPDRLVPEVLADLLAKELECAPDPLRSMTPLNFQALPSVAKWVSILLSDSRVVLNKASSGTFGIALSYSARKLLPPPAHS